MSVKRLRAAAQKLREHTEKLEQQRWSVDYGGDHNDRWAHVPDVLRTPYGNNAISFGQDHAAAEYVALVGPLFGMAACELLEEAADLWDLSDRLVSDAGEPTNIPPSRVHARALALADVVLGLTTGSPT